MGGVQVNGSGTCPNNTLTTGSAPNHLYDFADNVPSATTVTKFGGVYGGPFDYGNWYTSEYDNFAHLDGSKPYEATTPTPFYFNAENDFNKRGRPVVSPGIGAVGTISNKVATRDFDVSGGTAANPRFVDTPPTANTRITFPFDYSSVEGDKDLDRKALFRSEALRQEDNRYASDIENYIEVSGGTVNFTSTGAGAAYRWPQYPRIGESSPIRTQTSNFTTVVYVRFTGSTPGTVRWDVNHGSGGCGGAPEKGVLVVENGNVEVVGDRTPFHGTFVVRGSDPDNDGVYNEAGESGGAYTQLANACAGGGVDATGRITLNGDTTNINPNDSGNLDHNFGFSVKEVDYPGA